MEDNAADRSSEAPEVDGGAEVTKKRKRGPTLSLKQRLTLELAEYERQMKALQERHDAVLEKASSYKVALSNLPD